MVSDYPFVSFNYYYRLIFSLRIANSNFVILRNVNKLSPLYYFCKSCLSFVGNFILCQWGKSYIYRFVWTKLRREYKKQYSLSDPVK